MKLIELRDVTVKFKIPKIKKRTVFENFLFLFRKNPKTTLYALKDVSLEINRGETVGIVGDNGSGKTTLLSVIANIIIPDEGRCTVTGKVLPLLGLGVGFEKELTARDNMHLYGSFLGMRNREVDDKFNDIVEFAGIGEFIDVKLKNFSSGMSLRLAFSIAMLAPSEILLIDEVLEVGDKNFRKKCFDKITKFKEDGRTIILASHSPDMVRRTCEKTIWLSGGKVQKFGNTEDVLDLYLKTKNSG